MFKKEYVTEFLKKLPPALGASLRHPGTALRNYFRSVKFFLDLATDELRYMYFKYPQTRHREITDFVIGGYVFDLPDLPSFLFQWKEIMQDEIYRFEPSAERPVIIDIGANVGTSVLYFGTRFPDSVILAYEADPKIFGYLKRNVERNGIVRAELCNAAVFDRDGEISFAPDGADGGRITPGTAGETVPCADIRGILGRFESVDMLKIDVEGAEGEIVPAAGELLARVKNIFIEFHQRRGGPDRLPEILTVLGRAGFTYEIFNTQGLPAAPFVREHDHPVFSQQLEIFARKR